MGGSHGSVTQAGKVRKQTPKVDSKKRKGLSPRASYRVKHYKRLELGRQSGQNTPRRRRRRY